MRTVEEDDEEQARLMGKLEEAVIARIAAEERYGKSSPEHRAALAAKDAVGEELEAFYSASFDAAEARYAAKQGRAA